LWDIGAGLDKGFRVRVLGERLGDCTHPFADVVGFVLALHVPPSHISVIDSKCPSTTAFEV
jgi:hypothetical protein